MEPLTALTSKSTQFSLQMWIFGNPIRIEGTEFSNERAIYVCNHASPMDIFLMLWLTPTGIVGIAKKEVHIQLSGDESF